MNLSPDEKLVSIARVMEEDVAEGDESAEAVVRLPVPSGSEADAVDLDEADLDQDMDAADLDAEPEDETPDAGEDE
jgi:hypothetical protein